MDHICHSLDSVGNGVVQWHHGVASFHILLVIALVVVVLQVMQSRKRL